MDKIFRRRKPDYTRIIIPSIILGIVIGVSLSMVANSRSGGKLRHTTQQMQGRTANQSHQQLKEENQIMEDTLSRTFPL